MAEVNMNREYLLHTLVDCTWEKDEVIEAVYSNFVSNYQSKFRYESDVMKVENNFGDSHSTQVEGPSSNCGNLIAEDLCKDTNFKDDPPGKDIALTGSLSSLAGDYSVYCLRKPDESTFQTKESSESCSMKSNQIAMDTPCSEKLYSCNHFLYSCSTESSLTRHTRTHLDEKPYSCSDCSYSSSDRGALTIHRRTHSGEKPYLCRQCSYASSNKSGLNKHMLTHSGIKPYSCSLCSYSCSQKISLIKHARTHSGEKPFTCDQCSYCCSTKSALTVHKRTHSGEKPYLCSQCPYSCSNKSHLTRHALTHSGKKTI